VCGKYDLFSLSEILAFTITGKCYNENIFAEIKWSVFLTNFLAFAASKDIFFRYDYFYFVNDPLFKFDF
jgi:hypothetical protein